jgi:hypothetical protein
MDTSALPSRSLTCRYGNARAPLRHITRCFWHTQRVPEELDPFVEVMTELSDGLRWTLTRADGWDDFVDRLARLLPELSLRRRQALIMLLFALTEKMLSPEQLADWLRVHDATSEAGLEEFLSWLRGFRRVGEPTEIEPPV